MRTCTRIKCHEGERPVREAVYAPYVTTNPELHAVEVEVGDPFLREFGVSKRDAAQEEKNVRGDIRVQYQHIGPVEMHLFRQQRSFRYQRGDEDTRKGVSRKREKACACSSCRSRGR